MHDLFTKHLGDTLAVLGIVVAVLFGIAGLWAAYVFYKKAERIQQPMWSIETNMIIRRNEAMPSKLRVFYDAVEVDTVSISKILFWNEGQLPIEEEDVLPGKEYRVVAKRGVQILNTELLQPNNQAARLKIARAEDGASATIAFERLRHNGGGIFQIIHTGIGNDALSMSGEIRSTDLIERVDVSAFVAEPVETSRRYRAGRAVGLVISGMIVVPIAILISDKGSISIIPILAAASLVVVAIDSGITSLLNSSLSKRSRVRSVLQSFSQPYEGGGNR